LNEITELIAAFQMTNKVNEIETVMLAKASSVSKIEQSENKILEFSAQSADVKSNTPDRDTTRKNLQSVMEKLTKIHSDLSHSAEIESNSDFVEVGSNIFKATGVDNSFSPILQNRSNLQQIDDIQISSPISENDKGYFCTAQNFGSIDLVQSNEFVLNRLNQQQQEIDEIRMSQATIQDLLKTRDVLEKTTANQKEKKNSANDKRLFSFDCDQDDNINVLENVGNKQYYLSSDSNSNIDQSKVIDIENSHFSNPDIAKRLDFHTRQPSISELSSLSAQSEVLQTKNRKFNSFVSFVRDYLNNRICYKQLSPLVKQEEFIELSEFLGSKIDKCEGKRMQLSQQELLDEKSRMISVDNDGKSKAYVEVS
jgi:hypothetical protein